MSRQYEVGDKYDSFEEIPVEPAKELEFLRNLRKENENTLRMRDAQIFGMADDIKKLRDTLRRHRYEHERFMGKYDALLEKLKAKRATAHLLASPAKGD
jgi:hypothetical protein